MFDIGAMEILVIAVLAIVVVGPKDLPVMLRKMGGFISYFKKMSADFQSHVQDAVDQTVKETGIKDVKDTFDEASQGTWGEEDERRAQEKNENIMRETAPQTGHKAERLKKATPTKKTAKKTTRKQTPKSRKKST